jgi:hypothetical protein
MFLVGFGKGKFQQKAAGDGEPGKHDVLFSISCGSEKVMLENTLKTVNVVLSSKRQTSPNAGVMYHKAVEPTPQEPNFKFTVAAWHAKQGDSIEKYLQDLAPFAMLDTKENQIVFVPDEGQVPKDTTKMSQTLGALLAEPRMWSGDLLGLAWCVKWSQTGLMPVRPVVLAMQSYEIAAKQAVCF